MVLAPVDHGAELDLGSAVAEDDLLVDNGVAVFQQHPNGRHGSLRHEHLGRSGELEGADETPVGLDLVAPGVRVVAQDLQHIRRAPE